MVWAENFGDIAERRKLAGQRPKKGRNGKEFISELDPFSRRSHGFEGRHARDARDERAPDHDPRLPAGPQDYAERRVRDRAGGQRERRPVVLVRDMTAGGGCRDGASRRPFRRDSSLYDGHTIRRTIGATSAGGGGPKNHGGPY